LHPITGKKILTILNQPYKLAMHNYVSSPSIGATLFSGQELTADELLKNADIAMYQAKTAGRNALRFFDPQMQNTIENRFLLEDRLRKALANQQFELYYQPQINATHSILGAEVLIRWRHPKRGLLSPAEFIPLAEETGLILSIGQWVMDAVCAQLKLWQQSPLTRDLVLSFNVSTKQFFYATFVEQVLSAIKHHAINPRLLKLELTESVLVKNIKDAISVMNTLRQIGALPDFVG
jgi:predicted signal transduction protein with EAL and GGDEF domain